MIHPEQVYLAVEPVDMRWGIERLSCHVQHAIGRMPCDGSAVCIGDCFIGRSVERPFACSAPKHGNG